MEGEANGVAGKNGVPEAESHLGVCPVSPFDTTVSMEALDPSGSGKILL